MENECKSCNDLLKMMDSYTERKKTEALNRLAHDIRIEYQDYLSIKDETEISGDLGLNLKDQLERIFKILKKSGVNL